MDMAKRSRRQQDLIKIMQVALAIIAVGIIISIIITYQVTNRSVTTRLTAINDELQTRFDALQSEKNALQESIDVVARHTGGVPMNEDPNWNLRLVNSQFPIELDYMPAQLADVGEGLQVDARILDSLNQLLAAAKDAGFEPVITSAFRDASTQRSLFSTRMSNLITNQGFTAIGAFYETSLGVAMPGFSEHQLGLAVDISEVGATLPQDGEPLSGIYQWLQENSWRYGFIQRYPEGKTEITGVKFEPWHFRYVGVEAATEIFNQGVTLEEFLGIVRPNMVFLDPSQTLTQQTAAEDVSATGGE